ncbi:MAG: hypothetical protein J4473_06005 [Candidatus Aenigmarchaeota archaeon]|nr:hypothetical protein [Candidatus Aenigmarchaeota archaeon]
MEEFNWLIITLIILLLLVVVSIDPVYNAAQEAMRTNVQLIASDIAGIINAMSPARADTCTNYELPKMECSVTIDPDLGEVKVTSGKYEYYKYYIKTDTSVYIEAPDNTFACDKDRNMYLYFLKTDGSLNIKTYLELNGDMEEADLCGVLR